MAGENFSVDISMPGCILCAAKVEKEISARAAVRAVPLRVSVYYDPSAVKPREIVGGLRARGYGVALDRIAFRLPARPALPPAVWKAKIKGMREKVEGIVFASIDFGASRIVVDYLPSLVSPKEVREAVVGWGLPRPNFEREEVGNATAKIQRGGPDPGRVWGDNLHFVHPLGPGVSGFDHDAGVGGAAAGLQRD